MAKKLQAVNIILSARQASKAEFEVENPIIELDCFAINKEGYEDTITTGVKLGDGEKTWQELPYLTDVTPSLVTSWLEFEANAVKARLVTLPDTNFVYDLSEEFQNMVEENFNQNEVEHKEFVQRMDELNEYIISVNNNVIKTTQEINGRMDAGFDELRAADKATNESIAATKNVLDNYMTSNSSEMEALIKRMEVVESYAPIELIFSGGNSTDPIYTNAIQKAF